MGVVLFLQAVQAGAPTDAAWPRVTILKIAKLPSIDGRLDETEWAGTTTLSGFVMLGSQRLSGHQPLLRLAWHDEGLLIGVEAPLPPGEKAKAHATDWDGTVWQDDSIEVHVDLAHAHKKNYQFAVNALGTEFDSIAGDKSYNAEWQAAAVNEPGRWSAEIFLPWKAMEAAPPAAGHVAGFNVAVNAGWLGGILTWSPLSRGLHDPTHFAHLAFGTQTAVSLSGPDALRLGECRAQAVGAGKVDLTWVLSRAGTDDKPQELAREVRSLESGVAVPLPVAIPQAQGFPQGGNYLLDCSAAGPGGPLLVQSWTLHVGQPLELAVRAFITTNLLRLDVRPDATAFPAADTDVVVSVDGPQGRILERKTAPDPKTGEVKVELPGTQIPAGKLVVKASATQRVTGQVFAVDKTVDSPLQPPWLGTREGLTDQVPAPWTKLKVKKDAVRCWGRSYRFTRSILPTEVVTRDTSVLAGPITLTGRANGAPLAWTGDKVEFPVRDDDRVTLTGTARAAGVTLSGSTTVEFDGMLRVDLKLTPDAGVATLQDLSLEIPLKPEHARYLYHFPGQWGSIANSAALPADGWSYGFKPFVWLGDEDRGFAWFCESDRNWFPLGAKEALTVRREGLAVVLRCRLIQGEQQIAGPLEYTFGFHATPVKDPEKTVWDYRITHHGQYGLESAPASIGGAVTYPAAGRLNPEQGTVECWYRPAFENPERGVPQAERKNMTNRSIFTVKWDADMGHGTNCGFYWNQHVQGPVAWARKEGKVTLNPGAPIDWNVGQWYHLALTWSDMVRMYVDGKLVAECPNAGFIPISPEKAVIEIGGAEPMAAIDELRILRVARPPAETPGEYAPDADTLLLDHFEDYGKPGGKLLGEAGLSVVFGPAKFGQGPTWDPARAVTQLRRLADLGVRTICFHEHWSPYQSHPYVTDENRPKLRSLVDGAHGAGVNLLLYMSRQFADNAPEWELYSEEALQTPRSGAYTRQPPQNAYIACWNSPWKDFCLYHLGKLIDEFGNDGWYLDGPEWPSPCNNQTHGCGYTAPDGTVRPAYDIFGTREFMRRLYVLTRQRKPAGQLNIHNSTVMVTPTLAWGTSTWGGEQLDTHKAGARTLDVLPMDSFRTELMGRQWGIPSELLVYEGRPYYSRDMIAYSLLHGVLIRPSTPDFLLQTSALWRMYDRFPFKDATLYPYWNNADRITCAPAGVYATAYERKKDGLLLFVSNLGDSDADATVTLNFKAFGWSDVLAWDALTDQPLDATGGVLRLPLAKWRFAAVRIKPE
ncbi:MAG: hypothetical protein A3K19_24860 [Lentisphaerae bacterium RIFOXYB12_FULL_65_16]|nr:MAG: hypothetical protein A3K18_24790 [Lentisphaerae bacterium RIFOXYA12_64_32]OGV90703.1 MAG: hypothetical protein A3K19_24860 [Lentisphaerae bacterium RIFOXYB12_FULL_65_16]